MDTVLDFRSFDPRFRTGLIFSIFEGLRAGCSIRLIFGQDPKDVESQFKKVNERAFNWRASKIDLNTWQVDVEKIEQKSEGCCGICSSKTS